MTAAQIKPKQRKSESNRNQNQIKQNQNVFGLSTKWKSNKTQKTSEQIHWGSNQIRNQRNITNYIRYNQIKAAHTQYNQRKVKTR